MNYKELVKNSLLLNQHWVGSNKETILMDTAKVRR